jgi:hypothetical protein
MNAYPSVDESRDRMHRAGWSIGDACFAGTAPASWPRQRTCSHRCPRESIIAPKPRDEPP